MAVGDDPPNCKVMPALQSVLMSRLENAPFYDLGISKLLPLSYRSIARYTNTPFSNALSWEVGNNFSHHGGNNLSQHLGNIFP